MGRCLAESCLSSLSVLVALAAMGGCAKCAGPYQPAAAASTCAPAVTGSPTANALHDSTAANEPKGLPAAQRALALAAGHLDASQIAFGRNSPQVSGWPSGISAVTAVLQPGRGARPRPGLRGRTGSAASRLLAKFRHSYIDADSPRLPPITKMSIITTIELG